MSEFEMPRPVESETSSKSADKSIVRRLMAPIRRVAKDIASALGFSQ